MREALVCSDFLPSDRLNSFRNQVEMAGCSERVHLPRHKKGATIAYEILQQVAPDIVDFYQSRGLLSVISAFAGESVQPTPDHDQSSCSILIYEHPGDHIGWHCDWNFYNGRHFTALLSLVNQDAWGRGCSSADLMVQVSSGTKILPTPSNTLIVFEGAFLRHCVKPLGWGQRRVMLSMTFCTDPRASVMKSVARRFKDIAYFGPRALWT